ncbi:MAG: rRNA maturation RNase YbeY [Acetobacter sp.]|nr:rRNA maturation RNase YbeY [Acetobacter sp.]
MNSKIELNVVQENPAWVEMVDFDALKVAEELKELAFGYVAEVAKHPLLIKDMTYGVNVCLSDDESVHKLNLEFRGMDKPTNVLSFANIDDDEFLDSLEDMEDAELGDIILAFETLQREAEIKGISVYAHYCHLLVHGFLHLLGFDHQDDKEAAEMEGLEVEILAQFSIDNPYQELDEA